MSASFCVSILSLLHSKISVTTSIKSYIFGGKKMTWDSANDWCRTQHLELVSIHSQEQYETIKTLIPDDNYNYWTGLKHNGLKYNKNSYYWSDNTPFDYGDTFRQYPWNDIEPNSAESSCIRLQNTATFLWDDIDCNSTLGGQQCAPICQITTDTPTTSTPTITTSTQTPTLTTLIHVDNVRYLETNSISTSNVRTVSMYQYDVEATVKIEAHIEEARVDRSTTLFINDKRHNDIHNVHQNDHKHSINGIGLNIYTYSIVGIVVICCVIVIGCVLMKGSLKRYRNRDKENEYEKARVMSSSQMVMISDINYYKEGVLDRYIKVNVMNVKDECSDAESNIDKVISDDIHDTMDDDHDEDTDDSDEYSTRKVTDGYVDEAHDGIISDDEDNDKEIAIHVIEGGIDENIAMNDDIDYREVILDIDDGNNERVKTPKYANIADDEFIVMGDDEEKMNDGLTRQSNDAVEGEY